MTGRQLTSAELDAIEAERSAPFDQHEAEVVSQIKRLRAQREAKRRVDEEELAQEFVEPPSTKTLADELAIEEPELEYTIADLHPAGANTLLAAQFKVGKTTLMLNLTRSLVDGEPFLERHIIRPPEGNVGFWNYEVSDRQFRQWLRDAGVRNSNRASVWNLRGWRLPLTVPFVEDLVVRWLVERNITALIVDPFSRAYGGEENNNTEVGYFLEALDVIKRRAGVSDLFMAAHFGRGEQQEGEEHVRGATRLDDWADVRWLYRKDSASGHRYFRADGRDVNVAERRLGYEEETRRLWVDGGTMSDDRSHSHLVTIVRTVMASPGIGKTALRSEIGGKSGNQNRLIRLAEAQGYIRVEEPERNGLSAKCFPTEAGERFVKAEP